MSDPALPGATPLQNAKRERFVREYLVDLNATQAAIRAGYSPKTAYSSGQRMLKYVEIQARIVELQSHIVERTDLSIDWVLQELRATYHAARGSGQQSAANKSLELLGKHLGMYVERHELTGRDGGPIETVDVTEVRHRLADRIARFASAN